jgi:hypothetical protein
MKLLIGTVVAFGVLTLAFLLLQRHFHNGIAFVNNSKSAVECKVITEYFTSDRFRVQPNQQQIVGVFNKKYEKGTVLVYSQDGSCKSISIEAGDDYNATIVVSFS